MVLTRLVGMKLGLDSIFIGLDSKFILGVQYIANPMQKNPLCEGPLIFLMKADMIYNILDPVDLGMRVTQNGIETISQLLPTW